MAATPAIAQATWERRLARARHLIAENRARRAAGDPDVKLNVYERLLLVARRAKERANRPAIRLSVRARRAAPRQYARAPTPAPLFPGAE